MGLESCFLLRGQGADHLRWLTSHDQMIGFAARTHSDTSLKSMGRAETILAVARAAKMAIIAIVVVEWGFMPYGVSNSFGFDNLKIAAKLPTPRP